MKSRVWITKEELDRLKELFEEKLKGGRSVSIPIEEVLPLLEKPDENRILWCRQARRGFSEFGIRVGVRTHQKSYHVEVIDRDRWTGVTLGHNNLKGLEEINDEDLIPASDPEYVLPHWHDDLLQSVSDGEKVMLFGPTGCGKSSLVQELAARQKKKFMRVNLNGEMSVSDLIGGWHVQGKEMAFQYGPVPNAMRCGAWLCLDELDSAIPQVLFALQALLEDDGKLFIADTNEWIRPHPEFRLIATANTLGRGDETGLYAGTQVLNEAFIDRFHSVFKVDYLPAQNEIELLMTKVEGLELKTAQKMVSVASDLRSALQDGVIYSTFSTRKLLAWGRKTVQLECPCKAVFYTVLNKISQDDQQVVREVLQRHGFWSDDDAPF